MFRVLGLRMKRYDQLSPDVQCLHVFVDGYLLCIYGRCVPLVAHSPWKYISIRFNEIAPFGLWKQTRGDFIGPVYS
ncbi:hypothetical protein J6590_089254 [Homalodisca vitripennis]|nr:hypothetical protein J6590_089254 [Homalodisca vitripennis]